MMPAATTGADTELARRIALACYGVAPSITPLSALNNVVYRLHLPDGDRILKSAKTADAASIRKELMLIALLRERAVPVPEVEHEDRDGGLVGRPFLVMRSAGDRTVGDWVGRTDELAGALFASMGAVLARIHAIELAASGDIRDGAIVPRDWAAHVARLHGLADAFRASGRLDARDTALFRTLPVPDPHGRALCHGDFHTVQCIVRDGRITAVVDWERAWAGNPTVDLAITHAYLDFYAGPALTATFLGAYHRLRPLPADYDRAFLPVRMAHTLALLGVWQGTGRVREAERAAALFHAYADRWSR